MWLTEYNDKKAVVDLQVFSEKTRLDFTPKQESQQVKLQSSYFYSFSTREVKELAIAIDLMPYDQQLRVKGKEGRMLQETQPTDPVVPPEVFMAKGKVNLFMTELTVQAQAFNKALVEEIETALVERYVYKPEDIVNLGELIFSNKKITDNGKKLRLRKVTIALIIVAIVLFVFILVVLICAFCVVGAKANEIKSRNKKYENETNELKQSSEKLEKENEEKEKLLQLKKTKDKADIDLEDIKLEKES